MENLEKRGRYENAEIEVVTVDSHDVICTSGSGEVPAKNNLNPTGAAPTFGDLENI